SGLHAISVGLSGNIRDDLEQLRHGMVMYDSLYAWCRRDARL
ncbi:chromate resistance protein ChrB domain-containing protein, partial [Burkholderia pseudomallei]